MLPLLIGTALGAAKAYQDEEAEKRQRAMEAQIAKYSPWSGMQAQRPKPADQVGDVLQGGVTGAMMDPMFKTPAATTAPAAAANADAPVYQPGMGMAPYAAAAPYTGAQRSPWDVMGPQGQGPQGAGASPWGMAR